MPACRKRRASRHGLRELRGCCRNRQHGGLPVAGAHCRRRRGCSSGSERSAVALTGRLHLLQPRGSRRVAHARSAVRRQGNRKGEDPVAARAALEVSDQGHAQAIGVRVQGAQVVFRDEQHAGIVVAR